MNILFIDDEPYVLEEIRRSVDFESLGIVHVFTALNAAAAARILKTNSVEIIVSDIVMPGDSGIDFITWVHGRYPQIETIFVTCHAEFNFAKKAIELGSLDYLLKPLNYDELLVCIRNAQKRFTENTRMREAEKYKSYWFKYQHHIIERFWQDIIGRRIRNDLPSIQMEAEDRHIPFKSGLGYLLIFLGFQFHGPSPSLEEEAALTWELQLKGETELTRDRQEGIFFEFRRRLLLGVFPYQEPDETAGVLRALTAFVISCHQQFRTDISCCWCFCESIEGLAKAAAALYHKYNSNIAYFNCVLGPDDIITGPAAAVPDFRAWEMLLKKGQGIRVIHDLGRILEGMRRRRSITAPLLRGLRHDFLQMIYSVLNEEGIRARELFQEFANTRLEEESVNSIKGFVEWADMAIEKITACLHDTPENKMAKAVKFIQANLDRELSREAVAAQVYLNPDYFDRLFKKHYGCSVHQYIFREKIKIAVTLLADTEASVSDIAGVLGYANVSNFSAMFKKATGKNPSDYRKKPAAP